MRRMCFSTTGRLLVGLGLLVLVAGCSRQGSVRGKVTYNGTAMPGGYVSFVPVQGGGGGTASIDPKDGTYEVPKLPTGKMKVSVRPAQEAKVPKGVKTFGPPKDVGPPDLGKTFGPGSSGAKHVPIPEKYTDPDTSKLEVEIKAGQNTYDIPLTGPAVQVR